MEIVIFLMCVAAGLAISRGLGVNQSLVSYALATPEYDPKSSLADKIKELFEKVVGDE